MTSTDDFYAGLKATTWDLYRGDTSNWADRRLFLEIVKRHGQPVLDVGCGTGRIILDFLTEGIDTDGIDTSADMLGVCRERADDMGLVPALHQQAIEHLQLPRRYRTILGPSSVLQLVIEPMMAEQALARVLHALEPGGAFITPFSFAWRDSMPLDSGWQLLFERQRPSDGATVRSWTREWHEPARQLWHAEQRFEVELGGTVIERDHRRHSPEGRWYTREQAEAMFREAGFTAIEVLRGFSLDPLPPGQDADLFCVVGVKPG